MPSSEFYGTQFLLRDLVRLVYSSLKGWRGREGLVWNGKALANHFLEKLLSELCIFDAAELFVDTPSPFGKIYINGYLIV